MTARALRALMLALAFAVTGGMAGAQGAPDPLPLSALLDAAATGDAAAQEQLALRYHQGNGVLQNYAAAAEWARMAATQGSPAAQNLLGRYHHAGLGVPRRSAASGWPKAAAILNQPWAET